MHDVICANIFPLNTVVSQLVAAYIYCAIWSFLLLTESMSSNELSPESLDTYILQFNAGGRSCKNGVRLRGCGN